MPKIKVEYEYNAEQWWDNARKVAASVRYPDFTRLFNRLERHDETECSQSELEQFESVAKRLDGWDEGPEFARYPVIFER